MLKLLAPLALLFATQRVDAQPQTIRLPSEHPIGDRVVDQIWVTYYPARTAPAPAVIIVHSLGEDRKSFLHRRLHQMARYYAGRGVAAAVMELPYHMRRLPRKTNLLRLYTESTSKAAEVYTQASSDVSTVANWLRQAPGIDREKIGVVGLSLGAIVAHLAMGKDARLSAGVAMLGGGDLDRLRNQSLLARLAHPHQPALSPELEAMLNSIDPLTYAEANRPRRVLMVQAARDLIIPPSTSTELWEALGKPPIRWLDTGHFGLITGGRSVERAAADYLLQVWSGAPPGEEKVSRITASTFKLGILAGIGRGLTPALQWQALSIGMRPDHMSLFHLNFGVSGNGVFAGPGVTINPSLDVGAATRPNGGGFRPYASLHLVF